MPKDVAELVELSELVDVVYYKIAGERADAPVPSTYGLRDEPTLVSEESTASSSTVQVMVRGSSEGLETRAVARLQTKDGRYEVDAAVRYAFSEPLDIGGELQREFVERVGIMGVYPYLREGIHSTAAKLLLAPPVLGLIRAGDFRLADQPPPDVSGVDVSR